MTEFTDVALLEDAVPVLSDPNELGIRTCMTCGAAILLDKRDKFDPVELHRQWHEDE
jgi:hypothetical protein